MAAVEQVKNYLASWFQLGKRVLISDQNATLLPQSVIQGDRYSLEFEACWQQIQAAAATSYLEGTSQTVAELLSDGWVLESCARCGMPVPLVDLGLPTDPTCPCSDLPSWPNTELPLPRSPVSTTAHLQTLRDRLTRESVR